MVRLDGRGLTLPDIATVGDGASVEADPAALERMATAARAVEQAAREGAVYGRTTGVGANRDQPVSATGEHQPGRALLRSHAGGWGALVPDRVVRAALAIRANQLLTGASGASPRLATALADLLSPGHSRLPVVHVSGAVGTGDLTALAEVGLTLLGERPSQAGGAAGVGRWDDGDALPLMSSNAFTLGYASLGCLDLQRLSRCAMTVYAMSHIALRGNREALGPVIDTVTPFAGARETARTVTELLGPIDVPAAQLQDFFGLRAFPQVHGPFIDELRRLADVVEALSNAGSENPAVVATAPPTVAHHAGFHTAYLAVALDATYLALATSARSSLSRISHLLTDPTTGLPRFLAGGEPGASGLLIMEYSTASAVERLRELAASPRSIGTAHLSAAVEDDASHSVSAATHLPEAVEAYRHVVAFELLVAVRALRMRATPLAGRLANALTHCDGIPGDTSDHDLGPDIDAALAVVDHPDVLG